MLLKMSIKSIKVLINLKIIKKLKLRKIIIGITDIILEYDRKINNSTKDSHFIPINLIIYCL